MSAAAAEKKPRERIERGELGEGVKRDSSNSRRGFLRELGSPPLSLKCLVASRGIYLYEAVVVVPGCACGFIPPGCAVALPAAYSQIRLSSVCPHLG